LITELLIIIKFGHGLFTNPMPDSVYRYLWLAMGAYGVFFLLCVREVLSRRPEVKKVD